MGKAGYLQNSRRLAVVVFIFGLLSLAGYFFHLPALRDPLPSPTPMPPLSSFCLSLLGAALWAANPLSFPRMRKGSEALAGGVLLLTGSSILAILFQVSDPSEGLSMQLGPAVGMFLSALALILIHRQEQAAASFQYLSITTFALGIFGLTNFAMSGNNRLFPLFFMSSSNAVLLLIVAIATLFLTPDRGIMAIITSETSAGTMLRRLLPAMLGMYAIRWLRLMGENLNIFSPTVGEGTVAVIYFILGFGMIWWSGLLLYKSERERQRVEQQTLEQAQHIESILASTSDALYYIDNEGRYRYISRKGAELLGRPPTDILGKTGDEFGLSPNLNQQFEKLRTNVQKTGFPLRGTFHFPLEKTYEYIIAPVRNSVGKTQGVVASLRDITEREEMIEELRQSRERLAKAFRVSPNPIFISRLADGRYLEINDAFIRIIGFTKQEIIGHSSLELGILRAEDRQKILQSLEQDTIAENIPLVFFNKKREERHALLSADTFEHRGERFMIGIVVDVTARVQEEAKRQRLQRQQIQLLKEAAQMKDQFLSVISHELRTPLNAIIGFGSLLEDGVAGPLSPLQRDYISKVLKGSDRMLILIDDLLDFARIQAGGFKITPEETDYEALVDETLEAFAPAADEKSITLEKDLQVRQPVNLDRRRIQQVISNLIANSLKFTSKEGEVRIKAWISGDRLVTEVCDNGHGIAPENISKLFVPFQQLDMSLTRKVGGVGLGLSISKSIVEAHGGTIRAMSEGLGKGTTIRFELPLTTAPKTPAKSPDE